MSRTGINKFSLIWFMLMLAIACKPQNNPSSATAVMSSAVIESGLVVGAQTSISATKISAQQSDLLIRSFSDATPWRVRKLFGPENIPLPLSAQNMRGAHVKAVYSPSVVQVGATHYMFFGVSIYCKNDTVARDSIALASSTDGTNWNFLRYVIEPDPNACTQALSPRMVYQTNDPSAHLSSDKSQIFIFYTTVAHSYPRVGAECGTIGLTVLDANTLQRRSRNDFYLVPSLGHCDPANRLYGYSRPDVQWSSDTSTKLWFDSAGHIMSVPLTSLTSLSSAQVQREGISGLDLNIPRLDDQRQVVLYNGPSIQMRYRLSATENWSSPVPLFARSGETWDHTGQGSPDLKILPNGSVRVYFAGLDMNDPPTVINSLSIGLAERAPLQSPIFSWQRGSRDLSSDGRDEIVLKNRAGEVRTWGVNALLNGHSDNRLGSTGAPSWHLEGSGDFDGDGKADLLWRNPSTGEVFLWKTLSISTYSSKSLGTVSNVWSIRAVGDMNGDGRTDILWQHVNGSIVTWEMKSDLTATVAHVIGFATNPLNWSVQGSGDFNGDGKSDVLWRNKVTGETIIWQMLTASTYTATSKGVVGLHWIVRAMGDFNGDNRSDILWEGPNNSFFAWTAMANLGFSGGYLNSGSALSNDLVMQGLGDYNGDGKADILWRNLRSGTIMAWTMSSATTYTSVTIQETASLHLDVQ